LWARISPIMPTCPGPLSCCWHHEMGRPISPICSHTQGRAKQLTPLGVSQSNFKLRSELPQLRASCAATLHCVNCPKSCAIPTENMRASYKNQGADPEKSPPHGVSFEATKQLTAFYPQNLRFKSPKICTMHIVGQIYPKSNMP